MQVVLRNLTLGLYYGGPGYWVMEMDRAFEFDNIEEAERCFLSERMDTRPAMMEILFVEGKGCFGIKLPLRSIAGTERNSARKCDEVLRKREEIHATIILNPI
jgi:hypothetical protein